MNSVFQKSNVVTEAAECSVAKAAQQPTHSAGFVAMVYAQSLFVWFVAAYSAAILLVLKQQIVVVCRHAVGTKKVRSGRFFPARDGVLSTAAGVDSAGHFRPLSPRFIARLADRIVAGRMASEPCKLGNRLHFEAFRTALLFDCRELRSRVHAIYVRLLFQGRAVFANWSATIFAALHRVKVGQRGCFKTVFTYAHRVGYIISHYAKNYIIFHAFIQAQAANKTPVSNL